LYTDPNLLTSELDSESESGILVNGAYVINFQSCHACYSEEESIPPIEAKKTSRKRKHDSNVK
jgi:hypothetical protein